MLATAAISEQMQAGQRLRRRLKRSDHAKWDPSRRKKDPIEILLAANRERIADLVPIKMARMALSPFSFFRGTVPVMAADLSVYPNSSIAVQICGDAHVRNLGAYAGPDGRLIFDLNDFDETMLAPWEWDLKRLAASLILAGREAGNSERICRESVMACAASYRSQIARFCAMPRLEVAKYRIHGQFGCAPGSSVLQRAERATPAHSLLKLTVKKGKSRVFRQRKPVLINLPPSKSAKVLRALASYRDTLSPSSQHLLSFYRPVSVAFKMVGTGSVATYDYAVLCVSGGDFQDPLFLQVKQALQSAYAPYVNSPEKLMNQGERVARGQRLMQFQSDLLLGWTSIQGSDFLVRQLNDHKASVENSDLRGRGLAEYANMCGLVLARSHARSGNPAVLAGYLGNTNRWDKALEKFAVLYADQTTQDHEKFCKAIKSGKIRASQPYV
jgi:uncharacterized protein (DUF2252 family)